METVECGSFAPIAGTKGASVSDAPVRLLSPVTLTRGGTPLLVLEQSHLDLSPVVRSLSSLKIPVSTRTGGLQTRSRPFGFISRNIVRGDYCHIAALDRETPALARQLYSLASPLSSLYRERVPVVFAAHTADNASRFDPAWFLPGGVFTTGSINRDSALTYHFDKGNTKAGWSGMIVLRNGASGGNLTLPELGVTLVLRDGDVLFFDGQRTLHGVTPITLFPGGYRYSLVYYTLEQVWHCLPPADELQRIKEAKTRRHLALVGRTVYSGAKPELTKIAKGKAPRA